MIENCDTLLMVGTSYPYMEYLPKPGECKCVQIDSNPQRIGLRYPAEIGLVGDSKKTLKQLIPLLKRNGYRRFLDRAQSDMRDWNKVIEREGTNPSSPMKPQVVGYELSKRTQETQSSSVIPARTPRCGHGI